MQIYEFLKVKKVKCIDVSGMCLTKDKEYQLLGVTDKSCIINDDNGYEVFASIERFEPVLDNDNINMGELVKHLTVGKSWKEVGCNHVVTITEISSEFANSTMVAFESDCCLSSSPLEMFLRDFEPVIDNDMSKSNTEIDTSLNSVIPTFKVGDKVYCPIHDSSIFTLYRNGYSISYPLTIDASSSDEISTFDSQGRFSAKGVQVLYLATQENYELLCKLYPHLEFELPPKPLTGSDLTKGMFERGYFAVVCKCSNGGESSAVKHSPLHLIVGYNNGRFRDNNGNYWDYAIPCDHKTNLPLTENVLNETI